MFSFLRFGKDITVDQGVTPHPSEEDIILRDMIRNLEDILKRDTDKNYLKIQPIIKPDFYFLWDIGNNMQAGIKNDSGFFNIITKDKYGVPQRMDPYFLDGHLFKDKMMEIHGSVRAKQEIKFFELSFKLMCENMHSYIKFVENFCPEKRLRYGKITIPPAGDRFVFLVSEDETYDKIPFRYKYSKSDTIIESAILSRLNLWMEDIQDPVRFNSSFEGVEELANKWEGYDIGEELYKFLESDLNYDKYYYKIFGAKAKSADF